MPHSHYLTFQAPLLPPICLTHEMPNGFLIWVFEKLVQKEMQGGSR